MRATSNASHSASTASVIQAIEPTPGSLVDQTYTAADYRDAFLVVSEGDPISLEQFAAAYFLNQPRWLSLVSMNLFTREQLVEAVGDAEFAAGSSIGSWKVYDRGPGEIVFGDDMGFMQYRFSLLQRSDGAIEASTAVKYRWQRMSHLYFTLVKPMHRRFVPLSLRAAVAS